MSRPRILKILGRRFRFVLKTPVKHEASYGAEEFHGMCYSGLGVIEVDNTISPDEQRATAIHEVMHDLESIAGLKLKEAQVASLSTCLFAFIRDNPTFIAWLQEKE